MRLEVGGTVVARYAYDPYGQMVTKTGSAADGNPFRYISGYLDATGLYKLGARYYDPARGRFTQPDPLGGGYVYASDDPVNRIDPSGLNSDPVGGLLDSLFGDNSFSFTLSNPRSDTVCVNGCTSVSVPRMTTVTFGVTVNYSEDNGLTLSASAYGFGVGSSSSSSSGRGSTYPVVFTNSNTVAVDAYLVADVTYYDVTLYRGNKAFDPGVGVSVDRIRVEYRYPGA